MPIQIVSDYHMHSHFSPDSKVSPDELCRHALALGLEEIAITDHLEWHPKSTFPDLDLDGYFTAIESCREEFGPRGLTVFSGIELGNPHDFPAEVDLLLSRYSFDVVISSLHWLYDEDIHQSPCFAGRGPEELYAGYFSDLARMATSAPNSFIAHFDRIFWRGTMIYGALDLAPVEGSVRMALEAMVEHGQTLEVNAKYLDRHPGWNEHILTVLSWYREAGGKQVAVNSDAHSADVIGRNRDVAAALLSEAGLTEPVRLGTATAVIGRD
jgi:histidinol-phosphatase (PHP family)